MDGKKANLKEKFANEEVPIHVIGRNVEITDAMKQYALEKVLNKIHQFGGRLMDVTITMDIQKTMHLVDVIFDVNNIKIKVSGRTDNMYASIDQALDHLQAKLRRYHEKITQHHAKGIGPITEMNVDVIKPVPLLDDINDQIEEETLKNVENQLKPHSILSREKITLKTLTQDDAVMKMDLSGDHFLIYRDEKDGALKVIYRREDGNYGVIELTNV